MSWLFKQCCDEHWGARVAFRSGFLGVYAQKWDCWVIWQFYFQFFKEISILFSIAAVLGKTLSDVNYNRILYDPPPRILEIKAKIYKWDLIKRKSFCTTKETIRKVKRQPSFSFKKYVFLCIFFLFYFCNSIWLTLELPALFSLLSLILSISLCVYITI